MRGTRAVCDGESCRIRIIPAYAGNTGLVHVRHSGNGDHPRVCGEHCGVCGAYFSCLGSSPRMRGTPGVDGQWRVAPGIIPAYAGNTPTFPWSTTAARDHPRVCGEHIAFVPAITVVVGSSPRMRGTLHDWPIQVVVEGIIPAYAGNTRLSSKNNAQPYGSSPRMRGTLVAVLFSFVQLGIIPAYAGNTAQGKLSHADVWDHPRVCGEHAQETERRAQESGSSPRMRGTPSGHIQTDTRLGIIPAYAGNTISHGVRYAGLRDHPRVCGEHKITAGGASTEAGSSPRMRGTHLSAGASATYRGIIPAYAGNTHPVRCRGALGWDHPRVCGEHVSSNSQALSNTGSSPRMRGTHRRRSGQRHCKGIIPAYAGNT